MLKASAGGGGRGMRVVRSAEELPHLLAQAQAEASAAFSSGDMYMEKLVGNRATSNFRCSPTITATSKFSASANAASSAAIRS